MNEAPPHVCRRSWHRAIWPNTSALDTAICWSVVPCAEHERLPTRDRNFRQTLPLGETARLKLERPENLSSRATRYIRYDTAKGEGQRAVKWSA